MRSFTTVSLAAALVAVTLLTGCAGPSGSALSDFPPLAGTERDDQARFGKLDKQLQRHARSVTDAWLAGNLTKAQEHFRLFADLLPEDQTYDAYFINPSEREALAQVLASLEKGDTPSLFQGVDGLPSRAWVAEKINSLLANLPEAKEEEIPGYFVDAVHRQLGTLVDAHRGSFGASLKRMDQQLPDLRKIFEERDLPETFFYVALVESSFNPNARNPAGPAGLWQFIPGTARKYGLQVNRKLDQRKDPLKATEAAGDYLQDIVKSELGQSFFLTLAAYNVGEGRVADNLERIPEADEKNFWGMWERKMIPPHTRDYVVKIVASAVAGSYRDELGLPSPGQVRKKNFSE